MSPPVVKNVSKRQRDGYKTFGQWFDDENNVYIARNAGKYAKRSVKDSKWVNPFICCDWDVTKEEWVSEELMRCYEKYIRNRGELMSSLHELRGKQLGCWCKPKLCHGDVLVKLYKEKYGEQSNEKNEEPVEKRKKIQKTEK